MAHSSLLWYTQPASEWNEALPIGNGRLGCMIHGRTDTELLCLNEDSVWYGGPQDRLPKDARRNLALLRNLVRSGHHREAEKLVQRAFLATPSAQRHYEPLGNVKIEFGHEPEHVTGYRRELDLDRAIHKTEYDYQDVHIRTEMLASFPDQVLAMRVQSSSRIEFDIGMSRLSEKEYETNEYLDSVQVKDNRIVVFITAGGYNSVRACCALGVDVDAGGSVEVVGGSLIVNAKDALIVIASRTTYRHQDFDTLALSGISTALEHGAEKLWNDHIRDYQSLYTQMHLTLGPSTPTDALPTNKRLKHASPSLAALYTNYSRYLLLSSSRSTGSQQDLPANLQGIWNPSFAPAWGAKFTLNINLQMNYWHCLPGKLEACMEPLFSLLNAIAAEDKGQKTAKEMYGARGWCCHNNTDLWADTVPSERWMPAVLWPLGGVWLCMFIWEYYLFTLDKHVLEREWSVLKGAVEFCLDWLVEEEIDGKKYMLTNPSLSPENTFIDANGQRGHLCRGSTVDMTIISELFDAFIGACQILSKENDTVFEEVHKTKALLPAPTTCANTGRLQEWGLFNYKEAEPGHRHVSHLLGLYPFSSITPQKTPTLTSAAAQTLEFRLSHGGGHTGWSRAHLLCLYTRLQDSRAVAEQIEKLVTESTLPNLLDTHPPFQIDGNFGGAAGVLEALAQSHEMRAGCRVVRLLPACPVSWREGEVRGVRVRGGWTVAFRWSNGEIVGGVDLKDAVIESDGGERKGVLVFPDGKEVEFQGEGNHHIEY